MDYKLIFLIISYAAIFLMLLLIPFRRKKLKKEIGQLIITLNHNTVVRMIIVNVVSIFLVFLAFKMNYNLLISFALCGCSVFSSYIVIKDGGISNLDGVYEKALICNGYFIKYCDIQEFPVFKLPKEDRALYSENSLIILMKNKIKIELAFSSADECSMVVEKLIEIKVLRK